MQIVDFTKEWTQRASELVREAYDEERRHVSSLPAQADIPDLAGLCENGLSVAAVENGRLLGFLGAYGPWRPVFYTWDVCGVFSPLHAHAVQKSGSEIIWRRLYQAAAEKWVAAGAASHAITLFAHDEGARNALYTYGFGMRCMDLMRPMNGIEVDDACCHELDEPRFHEMTALRRRLADHLAQSPSFMRDDEETLEAWLNKRRVSPPRIFAAEKDRRIIAYMEVQKEGENFASNAADVMNICGAYCLEEYRGTGIAMSLLGKMMSVLRDEGYSCLGVDCESFNPTAYGFWTKHFETYTHSVVRRIDENAVAIGGKKES